MLDIDLLLAWGAAYKKVGPGETIFRENTQCTFYYQLVSGRVRWFNINDQGCEFIHAVIDPGECFGELPLFDDDTYAATAVAEEESLLIRLSKTTFQQMLHEQPEIHFAFTQLMAHRVRDKFQMSKSMACHQPDVRIKSLLAQLKKDNRNICKICNQLKLTRQQIADMTGLRVETVIRVMRHMHSQGELSISHGKVFF